jgi:transposase InsO family protein
MVSPNAYASTMGLNIPATTCSFGQKNGGSCCSLFSRESLHRIATSSALTAPTVPKFLYSYLFSSIQEVHATTEKLQHNYNYNRPHGSLNDLPPVEFKDHRNNYIDPLKNKSSEKEKKPNLV